MAFDLAMEAGKHPRVSKAEHRHQCMTSSRITRTCKVMGKCAIGGAWMLHVTLQRRQHNLAEKTG